MNNDLFTVDAFTEVPFKGNPAAVVLLHADDDTNDSVLQAIAAELNLSETAFVRPLAGGDAAGEYSLRWFTPTNEVPLCGHATLASAHALFNHASRGALLPRMLRFSTLSGCLTVERLADGDLCMVLPLNAPTACSTSACATPAAACLVATAASAAPCASKPILFHFISFRNSSVADTPTPFQLPLPAIPSSPHPCPSAAKSCSCTLTQALISFAPCRSTSLHFTPRMPVLILRE
jgi:hypothetical protein